MIREKSNETQYSAEVQDIMGYMPGFVMRYGMVAFAAIFALIFGLLYFIKYPDVIPSQITINANNAPKTVVAHSSGKLITLLIKENSFVNQGELLAILESNSKYEQVINLETKVQLTQQAIAKNNWGQIPQITEDFSQLGELQTAFQLYYSSYYQIKTLLSQELYSRRKSIVSSDIDNSAKLKASFLAQKNLLQKDYQLALDNYQAQKKLFDQKVISNAELRAEESKVLTKKSALEAIESSLINNNSSLSGYEKESIDLDKQLLDAKYSFGDNLNKLNNEIVMWRKKYLLIAPLAGVVTFFQNIQELQDLSVDQNVFFITPQNQGVFGEMNISQTSFGKIEVGQKVVIHLDSYPFQEFGSITGRISSIATIPSNNKTYLTRVSLPPILVTDIGYKIPFKTGLLGNGQIVTRELRVINRLYYSFNSLFEKKITTPPSVTK